MDFINLYIISATLYLLCVAIGVTIHKMGSGSYLKDNLDVYAAKLNLNELSVGTLSAVVAGVACFLIGVFTWLSPDTVTTQPEYMVTSYKVFRLLVVVLTFVVLVNIKPFILKETSFLILLSIAGILLMATSTTLIGFYLALELISLSSYILASTSISPGVGYTNNIKTMSYDAYSSVKSKITIVGGLKYFLLSALSSGLLVLGISLIYYSTGELNLASLARIMEANGGQKGVEIYISIYLMVTFVLFKLGSAPFHYWVADVYEKVNVLINYYLIAVAKIGMIFALLKLTFAFPLMSNFLIISSVASIVIGSFAGLVQSKLRRLLAYSSINHVGYIVLALSLSGIVAQSSYMVSTGISVATIYSLWLYVAIYSISTVTLFTILLVIIENGSSAVADPSSRMNPNLTSLATFAALKNNVYISSSFTIALLSLAGVPPLGGFMAKIAIFWQVLDTGNWFLATAAVLCSIIAAVYYLRVIKCIYFNSPYSYSSTPLDHTKPKMSFVTALIVSFTSLTLVAYPVLNPSLIFLVFN